MNLSLIYLSKIVDSTLEKKKKKDCLYDLNSIVSFVLALRNFKAEL